MTNCSSRAAREQQLNSKHIHQISKSYWNNLFYVEAKKKQATKYANDFDVVVASLLQLELCISLERLLIHCDEMKWKCNNKTVVLGIRKAKLKPHTKAAVASTTTNKKNLYRIRVVGKCICHGYCMLLKWIKLYGIESGEREKKNSNNEERKKLHINWN